MSRVKDLDFKRYKIVCNVTLGAVENNSIRIASRCLMDELDSFADGSFKNPHLFASAQVYGIYQE